MTPYSVDLAYPFAPNRAATVRYRQYARTYAAFVEWVQGNGGLEEWTARILWEDVTILKVDGNPESVNEMTAALIASQLTQGGVS